MDIPPEQNSPKNILNALNNDCIREVFLRFQNLNDFMNAADVCCRFQQCALKSFRSTFGTRTKMGNNHLCQERAESLLRTFGHLIQCMELNCTGDSNRDHEILRLLSNFGHNTLKELKIVHSERHSYYIPWIDELPRFDSLEELELDGKLPNSFQVDPPLKKLTIRNIISFEPKPWFVRPFPQLNHMCFNKIINIKHDMLHEFLLLNPQLKQLELTECYSIPFTVFRDIDAHSLNFEHLNLVHSMTTENLITVLHKFKKLKHLDVRSLHYMSLEDVINLFATENIPIETLAIFPDFRSEMVKNIPTLKTLKTIKIYVNIPPELLRKVMESQTFLENICFNLYLHDFKSFKIDNLLPHILFVLKFSRKNLSKIKYKVRNFYFDLKIYNDILDVVKDRVKVEIVNDGGATNISQNILKANQNWLNIYWI